MPNKLRKIINDPVYGFITIDHPLLFQVVSHPYFQRMRRINQMAMALLVYPGAVHTRLHHSLGAYHLMCNAIQELCSKDVMITPEEQVAVKAAILLHDIGHGPFSHALENKLIPGVHHETLSLDIMHRLNHVFGGQLDMAIAIFTDTYPKKFLHQLVSGQLDMDRMDYLTRDSFFTGVSEGVIGYDRILKMLVVHDGELMVEEKAIYSIEKFLVARRLMYWQVYLHKTVLAAEKMLIKITERARYLVNNDASSLVTGTPVDYFLKNKVERMDEAALDHFCLLDDFDFMHCLKVWSRHSDLILRTLCSNILNRRLLKIRYQQESFPDELMQQKRDQVCQLLGITAEESDYFVFGGVAANVMYQTQEERINILFKNGEVKDISQVDNALIQKTLTSATKKFYFCFYA